MFFHCASHQRVGKQAISYIVVNEGALRQKISHINQKDLLWKFLLKNHGAARVIKEVICQYIIKSIVRVTVQASCADNRITKIVRFAILLSFFQKT